MYKFDYARDSLKYLIKTFDIKELFIPYYLCDVIRHSLFEVGCKPLFYHIDDNFMPTIDFGNKKFALYPNYFGICDFNVKILTQKYTNIIIDNAHSFYSMPSGFASFNSERKFHNVEKGSYLWIKKKENPKTNMFSNSPLRLMRLKKFIEADKRFQKRNSLCIKLNNIYSPFCYPFLAATDKEADDIAEKLKKEGKIIYRYWNALPKSYNEYKFYRRLVPVPLD